jgi:hypothetical protein
VVVEVVQGLLLLGTMVVMAFHGLMEFTMVEAAEVRLVMVVRELALAD